MKVGSFLGLLICVCHAYANTVFFPEIFSNDHINAPQLLQLMRLYQEKFNFENVYDDMNNTFKELQQHLDERQVHPDWGLNTVQLIKRHGYPVETHTITTEDGYKLGVYRITGGKHNYNNREQKPVVLVMAGILCSSADWVVMGPGKALAYLLADAGYDVWLGNNRGTTPSRKHIKLKPKQPEFWNFSFHEMGTHDLPAMIDYILEKTQQPNLHYIAHSQGATSFFVMASERPEYNQKIRLMSALAPVTYSGNVKNPFVRMLLPYLDKLIEISVTLNFNEILRHTLLISLAARKLCNDDASTQDLCSLILFLATGFDEPQMNKTMLPVIYSNFPAGSSMKQIWHFAKNMKSGLFQQFDYGAEDNMEIYGQETPPDYDLSKATAPVAVFYSKNDWMASDVDAKALIEALPNVALDHLIEYKRFNHLDHMWAIDANTLVYDIVIDLMKNY